jgi:hypothetical protein|tara:strand:- start:509 stop:730 length:222 start_codon:yes stop_codon:yes gene_type:complete
MAILHVPGPEESCECRDYGKKERVFIGFMTISPIVREEFLIFYISLRLSGQNRAKIQKFIFHNPLPVKPKEKM